MLKPCPFCGHDEPTIEQYGTPRFSTQYECGMCGCRLETNEERDHGLYWNYRPCEKALEAHITKLEAELAEATENLDWLEKNPRRIVHSTGYRGAADSWCWRDADAALATHEAPTLREAIKSAREGT